MSTTIRMAPTKAFFVRMLTRDIDLRDAILDLLDNCVDGIVRTLKAKNSGSNKEATKPYQGYFAEITASANKFTIKDNCGGIPKEVATKSAFRLGRPSDMAAEKLETVGVYGIGMKRAIFKLGQHAVVTSQHENKAFKVEIDGAWLKSDDLWELTLEEINPNEENGTQIEVTDLYPEIQRAFATGSELLKDLNASIRQLFAVIMAKGFTVRLNGVDLVPIEFRLLMSGDKGKNAAAINPYVFKVRIGQVTADVVVGFYRRPLSEAEIEEENESPRADLEQAGWSVICNDRLVLRGDKTAVTGWGTANVPRFHNQFSSIAGIVTLRSTNPQLLPLNTTKRGIETSSDIYFRLLDPMRIGMKKFTDYTNKWKSRNEEAKQQFQDTNAVVAGEIPNKLQPSLQKVSDRKFTAQDAEAHEFQPTLPQPSRPETDTRIIRFTKPLTDIKAVAVGLLDDEEASPATVGEACFADVLGRIQQPRRRS